MSADEMDLETTIKNVALDPVTLTAHTFSSTASAEINTGDWFNDDTMQSVKKDMLGFLLTQGWVVDSFTDGTDETGRPARLYTLKRRSLETNKVLNTMIKVLNDAHNSGRLANDTRYNNIITTLKELLTSKQNTLDRLLAACKALADDFADIESGLTTALTEWKTSITGKLEGWGDSSRERIETAFANLLSRQYQDLASRGLSNTLTRYNIQNSNEREKQIALTDLEDKKSMKDLSLSDSLYEKTLGRAGLVADMKQRAYASMHDLIRLAMSEQNASAAEICRYIEARQDVVPELTQFHNVIASMMIQDNGGTAPTAA